MWVDRDGHPIQQSYAKFYDAVETVCIGLWQKDCWWSVTPSKTIKCIALKVSLCSAVTADVIV